MKLSFDINTDIAAIKAMAAADCAECLHILSMKILVDCNYFCKQDQGTLISSSITASDPPNGNLVWDTSYANLVWDTSYANRQYWLPATVTDINSNASHMWCHKAYDRFGDEWSKLLQRLFDNPSERETIKAGLQAALRSMAK